jgi:CRP-like cAMP-binding protein
LSFGYLASLAILGALLADLLITPCLLVEVPLIGSWDLLRTKLNANILQKSLLFADMRMGEVKRIALLGLIEKYDTGHYILRQGDSSREMYLLLSGTVEITVESEKGEVAVVERLVEGDTFGEMAFVTGDARSANVVSQEQTEVLRIDRSSLERVRRRFPKIASKLYFNLSAVLSKRLEETTSSLAIKS